MQLTSNKGMSNDAPIHECESEIDHYTWHYVQSPMTTLANCVHDFIVVILLTELLCDNSNSLTYEPRNGQSPTLSRANCVTAYLN